jgi:hypothetical protein
MNSIRFSLFASVTLCLSLGLAFSAAIAADAEPKDDAPIPGSIGFRAAYDITSAPDTSGEAISMSGLQAMEWLPDCEGGSLQQRIKLSTYVDGREAIRTDISISSWEAADASQYRFFLSVKDTSGKDKVADGTAERSAKGVTVRYKQPEGLVRELPADTQFPWQHIRAVIKAARNGETAVSATVLRGELPETDPAQVYLQVLGQAEPTSDGKSAVKDPAGLLNEISWRLIGAVFETPGESTPTFETNEVMSSIGVMVSATIQFPELGLRVRLREVEKLPSPECG